MKLTTTGETTGIDDLTMEYKDDLDPDYSSDIPSGSTEADLRIFYWDSIGSEWTQVPGSQGVDQTENTVTASLVNLASAELYSIQPLSGFMSVRNWRDY